MPFFNVTSKEGERGIAKTARWIGEAGIAARDLTRQLRPPALYEGGLIPALQWLASDMKERHGLQITIDAVEIRLPLNDDAKALIFECVRELLFNVTKYAEVTAAEVVVREEEDLLWVKVADQGRGFDVDGVAGNSPSGGFGLFSIRERLTALGGGMTIESLPKQGTKVELMVPVAKDGLGKPVPGPQNLPAESDAFDATRIKLAADRRARVLVVDDHAIVREGIANLLAADQRLLIVGEAADGEEAVNAVKEYSPDVVLMDLNMPRMNGIEATREIVRIWPATIIIGLSVQNDDATAKSMINAGAAAFLSKETDAEQMTAVILELVKKADR